MKSAIEEYFPIVDINRLAVPERNAFKPIYTMHKWFARRSSSVFRAILLGALKPAGTDIMKEFYKDHTNDPDTKGKVILDPFMGGGTTVVEALRLGCKVIGVDLNPVAWFIVKTEVEPVDLNQLQTAFDRLANRTVEWSGRPLKETLLSLYKTECPECGNTNADTIYTFWVKSAPCTTATCNHWTPLFGDYIVSQKKPSIRFFPDCECPKCKKKFDWEREPASMVGNQKLMINSTQFSAGEGRGSARWIFSHGNTVECPWCNEEIKPIVPQAKLKRKKVPLCVLYCPKCEEVWQYRGEVKEDTILECPSCKHNYNPQEGNLPDRGKFICHGTCNGNVDAIISAIRTLPDDQLLPIRPYALEGYCEKCGGTKRTMNAQSHLFDEEKTEDDDESEITSSSLLRKNHGKFFKRYSAKDMALYQQAKGLWEKNKDKLPYPKSEVPLGEKTKSGLLAHHYMYWHQMFNERQLLNLSTLLKSIDGESNIVLKEMLLTAFFSALETSNLFTRYHSTRFLSAGVFARHDYQPKVTICENNVWGTAYGNQTFVNTYAKVLEGKSYGNEPTDMVVTNEGYIQNISSDTLKNVVIDVNAKLFATPSQNLNSISISDIDYVITDPPYAGNVNYSELADFFYVWLRLVLAKQYNSFIPEYTPKTEEVVENKTRGKSATDFKDGLKSVFSESYRVSREDAALIFTFHHAEDSAWEALLDAVCEAGYFVEAVYPIHGEAENSLHLMNNESISYDLIHVCRKRPKDKTIQIRSWAGVRQEIRQRAREEARLIESGRYGNEPLSASDINILLIGKCLELYSKHYGAVIDFEDKPVPLRRALEEIKVLVDQLISKDHPLPSELEDLLVSDPVSYVYLTTLCNIKEIKSDDVNKRTRGIIAQSVLKEKGIIIKGREKRGRTFEVKQPLARLNELKQKFHFNSATEQPTLFPLEERSTLPNGILFVDCVHLLLGMVEAGENVLPWMERLRGFRPQIRAAMEYLSKRNKNFEPAASKIVALMDERTLFTKQG